MLGVLLELYFWRLQVNMEGFLVSFEGYKRCVVRVFKGLMKGHSEVCIGAYLRFVGRTVE